MANDWIKMRGNLRTHPKVVRIASALKADRLRVVGGLHAVWSLFDEHSVDGTLHGYTPSAIDDDLVFPGFADAMIGIGWLAWDGNDGLTLPEFDAHNSASAKRRAQETERKRTERKASKERPQDVRTSSAACPDEHPQASRTKSGPEKRREDIYTPQPPKGVRFTEFWDAWPKNERKQDKAKCQEKWKRDGLDALASTILADIATKRQTRKWQEGFIEAPLVYLNNRRWEDGARPDSASSSNAPAPAWEGAK